MFCGNSKMNRNSRYCFLLSLFLLLLVFKAASGQNQKPKSSNFIDSDVATVRGFFNNIFGSKDPKSQNGNTLQTGRTFGHKRIQFMMMPMIYKMGVMMTMLAVLTVISLKGLMIGVMLLVLKLSAIFGKFYASAHSYGHSSNAWTPPQPVHVHLHGNGGYPVHGHPYHGWESVAHGPPDESYYYKG